MTLRPVEGSVCLEEFVEGHGCVEEEQEIGNEK